MPQITISTNYPNYDLYLIFFLLYKKGEGTHRPTTFIIFCLTSRVERTWMDFKDKFLFKGQIRTSTVLSLETVKQAVL